MQFYAIEEKSGQSVIFGATMLPNIPCEFIVK